MAKLTLLLALLLLGCKKEASFEIGATIISDGVRGYPPNWDEFMKAIDDLSQCLVLDSLSENQNARFYLLLTMLLEYGRFFSEALRGKKKQAAAKPNGSEHVDFARDFMAGSDRKLLKESFEFADFTAPDGKGGRQKFALGVSDLSQEARESILRALCLCKKLKKES